MWSEKPIEKEIGRLSSLIDQALVMLMAGFYYFAIIVLSIVGFITAFVPPHKLSSELSIFTIAVSRQNLIRRYVTSKASTCSLCSGKEVVNCGSCNGSGIDKKNGSILERWCCKKCKGT